MPFLQHRQTPKGIRGEKEIAEAVRAVARLPRAKIVILGGAIMGEEITEAVKEVQVQGYLSYL